MILLKKIVYLPIFIVVVTVLCSTLPRAHAYAPVLALKDQPIENIVTYFSDQNKIDPKLALSVMSCESGGSQNVTSDHGLSHGVFQIQKETWIRFTKEMGETLDYDSPYDQAKVATWAFAHDHGPEWTTYVAIMNGGSYTFYSHIEHRKITVHCKLMV